MNKSFHSGLGRLKDQLDQLLLMTTHIAFGIMAFFAVRMAIGLAILTLSAKYLTVGDFAIFSQFFVFASLVNLLATGGCQNGLIRQAAAAMNGYSVRTAVTASMTIWVAISVLIMVTLVMFPAQIAAFLTGSTTEAWAVPWIGLAALGPGGGQIYCALLTGRGRVTRSLAAQGLGAIAGGMAALMLLLLGDPIGSVISYSAGSTLSAVAAWRFAHELRLPRLARFNDIAIDLRILLAYSRTSLAVSALMPAVLFVLRYAYREASGVEALGYWLMANRVSDLTTQMTGIFMTQVFLPRLAATREGEAARSLVVRAASTAVTIQGSFLAVFLAIPGFIIGTFLSDKFLPAIPYIIGYMATDVLRCVPVVAQNIALAQRRTDIYFLIEAAIVLIFAAATLVFIALGREMAPVLAYVCTYAVLATIGIIAFLRRWMPLRSA